jgi:NADH-quinone oxidoreductase subunit L
MPLPAVLLIIATLFPLAGYLTLLALGKRLGSPLAGYVATFFVAAAMLCSGWGMLRWSLGGNYYGMPFGKGSAPIAVTLRWLPIGSGPAVHAFEQDHPGWLDFVLYFDSLTVSIFLTVTLATLILSIFTVRSLRRDPAAVRFFCCLLLTLFATLALLLSGTLLQLVLFLEMAGFAASLLVGFRIDNALHTRAGGKMFVVSRLGTLGLLLGLGILLAHVGNLSLPDLWMMLGAAGGGRPVMLLDGSTFSAGWLTAAGVALFMGAAARCAQFPLHVWAGDVADSVAPAAAMVFAIGLSLAGMFFIARLFPLLTPSARLLAAIVGATTLLMASLISITQDDIKRVLIFVSVAQLGYMCLAIGAGSWGGAMFHLVAYVFFQTLLFLAAGAVIRAARGQTQLSQLGGLWLKMPVTAVASLIGVLAVCGAGWESIGLSGYFSRGLILRQVGAFAALASELHHGGYWLLFLIAIGAIPLIAFSMTRWWLLVFAGRPRDQRLYEHAREVSMLFWPLAILAILTALAGNWLGVREMLEGSIGESRQAVQIQSQANPSHYGSPLYVFSAAWSDAEPSEEDSAVAPPAPSPTSIALARGERLSRQWAWRGMLLGMLAAVIFYLPATTLRRRLVAMPPLNWICQWLDSRMYFDELNDSLFVSITLALAELVHRFDRAVVEWPVYLIAKLTGLGAPAEEEEISTAGEKIIQQNSPHAEGHGPTDDAL